MIPHSQPHSRRVHVPHGMVRRSAALLAAALVIGGTPLVARALGDESVPEIEQPTQAELTPPNVATTERRAAEPGVRSIPDLGASIEADPGVADAVASPEPVSPEPVSPEPVLAETAPEPAVDPVIAVLADSYTWDERGPRIVLLQEALGLAADGWYASATQQAHRVALDLVGLPTDTAPTPVLPPGPDPSKWEALRQWESNGNYAITNPSGKYRGAYQFDRSTWNSVAERHAPNLVGVDPAAASPADQDAMALALYSERGARPWPHCGRHLS